MVTSVARSPKSIHALLERGQGTMFRRLEKLHEVLKNVRYEGKIQLGRNLAELEKLLDYFEKELDGHMKEEERVFFPFVQKYIPRLEPMVCLLVSEHEDFRLCLKSLKRTLVDLRRRPKARPILIDRMSEQGIYLICLLRSHMWMENNSLYKAAAKELRPAEKRELISRIENQTGARP